MGIILSNRVPFFSLFVVLSKFQTDQHERGGYFFSRLQKRYAKGHQVKRATNAGFWKSTGKERPITRMASGEVIGKRKTLVFHRKDGSSAARTPWFIYEYHADKRFVPDDVCYPSLTHKFLFESTLLGQLENL